MDYFEPSGVAELPSWTPLRSSSMPSINERPKPRARVPAYADNWRWRDPMPPLPQPLPVALQLDRLSWRPAGSSGLSPEQAGRHRRTGAFDHRQWVRCCHFVQPGLDIAYQAYKVLVAMLVADRARPEDGRPPRPTDSAGYRVFPDLFWSLGNPPLLGQRASRALVQKLRDEGLLDRHFRPVHPLGVTEVAAVVEKVDAERRATGGNFAQLAAVALNVVYDLCTFSEVQTVLRIYRFRQREDEAGTSEYDRWSLKRELELQPEQVQQRAREVQAALQACDASLRDKLDDEAVEAAALDPSSLPSSHPRPDAAALVAPAQLWLDQDAARQARVDARVVRPALWSLDVDACPGGETEGPQTWQVTTMMSALSVRADPRSPGARQTGAGAASGRREG